MKIHKSPMGLWISTRIGTYQFEGNPWDQSRNPKPSRRLNSISGCLAAAKRVSTPIYAWAAPPASSFAAVQRLYYRITRFS